MDPNEALDGLRRYSADVQALAVAMSDVSDTLLTAEAKIAREVELAGQLAEAAVEQAEHVEAIDEWLCKGGFLPDAWRHEPSAAEVADWCHAKGYRLVVHPDAGDRTLDEPVPKLCLIVQFIAPQAEPVVVWQQTGDSLNGLIASAMRYL